MEQLRAEYRFWFLRLARCGMVLTTGIGTVRTTGHGNLVRHLFLLYDK